MGSMRSMGFSRGFILFMTYLLDVLYPLKNPRVAGRDMKKIDLLWGVHEVCVGSMGLIIRVSNFFLHLIDMFYRFE